MKVLRVVMLRKRNFCYRANVQCEAKGEIEE